MPDLPSRFFGARKRSDEGGTETIERERDGYRAGAPWADVSVTEGGPVASDNVLSNHESL